MANQHLTKKLKIALVVNGEEWPNEAEILSLVEQSTSAAIEIADLAIPSGGELSIVLSDDKNMQQLNQHWRNKDRSTNVLSFPAIDIEPGEMPDMLLGDIVLARETIVKEAVELDISFLDHLSHLVIHGFLHIFGYDHINDDDAKIMEDLETRCLRQLNIADPYGTGIDNPAINQAL